LTIDHTNLHPKNGATFGNKNKNKKYNKELK
jgi:hypothetical protein